jgi:hypothetical protein
MRSGLLRERFNLSDLLLNMLMNISMFLLCFPYTISEFQGLAPMYLFVDFLKNIQYPIVKYSDRLSNLIEKGENEDKGKISFWSCVSVINTVASYFGPTRGKIHLVLRLNPTARFW